MGSKKKSEKTQISNICCFGANLLGVSTACVIAYMCPSLKIAVVDFKPDKVSLWNTKQIPATELGLEDMIKKSQNNNLVFTTDTKGALRDAHMIILSLEVSLRPGGSGEGMVPDLTDMENVARLIAETSNQKKIIVEKGSVPPGNSKVLKCILKANSEKNIHFEILSNPDFFPEGKVMEGLLNPDRILIGSDETSSGLAAAESLASIYANWVPREKIITVNIMASELAKISANAFLAQKISSISALSQICEAMGADISEVIRILGGHKCLSSKYMEPTFGFGGPHLAIDVRCLIYMLERIHLKEEADYWQTVLDFNEYQQLSFKKKILSSFYNTLIRKKITIWGVAFKRNSIVVTDSPAIHLCRDLLEEGAKLRIYDPQVEKRQIIEELKAYVKDVDKYVTVFDDPYKSAQKTNGIVLCTDFEELKNLDFTVIYKDMLRPAYIFDGRKCLPDEKLTELGFVVLTIGKTPNKHM